MSLASTARAAVLIEPNKIVQQNISLPVLGADDALLRVEACGLCGTDIEQYRGEMPASERHTPFPSIPGHEPVGVIADIGKDAARRWGVEPGDRVAVRPFFGCGKCEACAAWQPERCPGRGGTYGFIGVDRAPGLWGGYADMLYLDRLSVVRKIDPTLPAGVAALYNPLASGMSWAKTVPETGPNDRVVILGAGVRGLCCVIGAKEAGAKQVVVTGLAKDAHKLELARRFGADDTLTVEPGMDVSEALRDITGGGAEVIIDTTPNAPDSMRHAIEIAVRGSRIVMVGLKGPRAVDGIMPDDIVHKEIVMRGVLSTPFSEFAPAISVLESRRYRLEDMHTHSFDVADAEKALRTLEDSEDGAIHVAIVPGA
jgi:threonine dehydrogenase-like Zn-dependent dehydrogenase